MYITKDKFNEICKKYPTLILSDGDAVDALSFVQDLLEAEADALKVQEPTAVNSITRLDAAAYEVFNVQGDIENEEFLEQEGEKKSVVDVDFRAGYYSWDVFVNGENRYSFEVDSETFVGMNSNDLRCFVENMTDAMREELLEDGKKLLDPDEVEYLQDQMYDAWMSNFDIELASQEGEPRVVRTMEDLKDFLMDQGWSADSYESDMVIGQFSPAGEDFWFSVVHDGDVEKAIEEIKEYARDFDIDEHVQTCMGMRGAPGVEELVDDAKAIQGMLNKLADAVDVLEVVEEQPALDDVIKDCAEQADKSRDTGKDVIKQER